MNESKDYISVGGIVGWGDYITIDNCVNYGNIKTVAYSSEEIYKGEIYGMYNEHTSVVINDNCKNNGMLNVENLSIQPNVQTYIGGIIGYCAAAIR